MELSREEIMINRLLRKIERLGRKVDFYKKRCSSYQEVIDLNPALESRYRTHQERIAERERVRQLEQRITEQSKLISLLEKKSDC